jgi:DNA polymerase III delta subunit
VVPAISRYDTQLLNQLQDWQDALERKLSAEETSGADRSRKKRRATTELTIVKNPNNVFPVYQLFKKSEKFSLEALIRAFEALTAADMRIKSGSEDKSTVLEALVIKICT